jgi:ribosome-associated heat shock protein Hsp15
LKELPNELFATMVGLLETSPSLRVDKWLWAVRLFKTRSLALAACRAGHVKVDGSVVKAARNVHVGDTVVVRTQDIVRTLKVTGITERRVGAKLVPGFFEDQTPPEEWERNRRSLAERILSRPKGAGRPTKRDRRKMEDWRG